MLATALGADFKGKISPVLYTAAIALARSLRTSQSQARGSGPRSHTYCSETWGKPLCSLGVIDAGILTRGSLIHVNGAGSPGKVAAGRVVTRPAAIVATAAGKELRPLAVVPSPPPERAAASAADVVVLPRHRPLAASSVPKTRGFKLKRAVDAAPAVAAARSQEVRPYFRCRKFPLRCARATASAAHNSKPIYSPASRL